MVKLIKRITTDHYSITILRTPCFPNLYYAGFAFQDSTGKWHTAGNDPCSYFRDLDEAHIYAKKLAGKLL